MNTRLDNYRGTDVFVTEKGEFVATVQRGTVNTTFKKTSLASLKKAIDAEVEKGAVHPVKVMERSYSQTVPRVLTVVGIRKNRERHGHGYDLLVATKLDEKRTGASPRSWDSIFRYDGELVAEFQALEKEKIEYMAKWEQRNRALKDRLLTLEIKTPEELLAMLQAPETTEAQVEGVAS